MVRPVRAAAWTNAWITLAASAAYNLAAGSLCPEAMVALIVPAVNAFARRSASNCSLIQMAARCRRWPRALMNSFQVVRSARGSVLSCRPAREVRNALASLRRGGCATGKTWG